MYDYVEVDPAIELPELEVNQSDIRFQTKDFQNLFRTYRVTEDGRLLEEEFHIEEVPKEERPFYDEEIDGFEEPGEEVFGSMEHVTDGWHEKDFHGVLHIVQGTDDHHYRYNLEFTRGVLSNIDLYQKRERD